MEDLWGLGEPEVVAGDGLDDMTVFYLLDGVLGRDGNECTA